MRKGFSVVGASFARNDSLDKVIGAAEYTCDLVLPGMVYGKILRSPYAHARVLSIDTTGAKKTDGVLGVITFKDVPEVFYNCSGTPPSALVIKDEKILTGEPKHVGDKIAAVVAVTPEICDEALSRIVVEYEELPVVLEINEALADGAPVLHRSLFESNLCKTFVAEEGDIEQGLKDSYYLFTGEYKAEMVQHIAMEPTGCICHYTRDDTITVWGTSQTPYHDRRILSDLTGLSENRIRVIKPEMGGGFGGRQQLHHQPVGVFLSKLVRRPVKMIYDREEEMYASAVRHGAQLKLQLGVNRDQKIVLLTAEVFLNTGGYATQGPIVLAAMSNKVQYRVPHYRFEGYCVYTNAPVAGAMRGYGNPQLNFARETLINEACAKMGWNTMEFRLKNHLQVGDKIPSLNYPVLSCSIQECSEAVIQIKDKIEEQQRQEKKTIKRAWGLSFGSHGSGITERDQGAAVVMVNDDGSVNLLVGSADIGQGSDTILAQIVAEELGLARSQVITLSADTGLTPYDTGTFSSRQAYVTGNAVLLAAQNVKESLVNGLARVFSTDKSSILFQDGKITIKSSLGTKTLSFEEAVRKASFGATGQVFIGQGCFKPDKSPPPYAVCLVQIEVDEIMNSVKIPHIIMSVDVGQPINPDIVEGQVHGGVSMGLGAALFERIQMDNRKEKPLESDLLYYKVPLILDSPAIHVHIANGFEPSGPFGAKSVGELPTVPVAAAVVDALYQATGVWVRETPILHKFNLKKMAE